MKYEITQNGEVFNEKGKELKQYTGPNGYPKVALQVDGKQKDFSVHRLVAEAHLPNPLNLPCVNHKDGNKQNNHVDNLEWCTYKQNTKHSRDIGLQKDGNHGGGVFRNKEKNGYSWRAEIMHHKKIYRKTSINKEVVEAWLAEKLKELENECCL